MIELPVRRPRQQAHDGDEEYQEPGLGQRAGDRTRGGTRNRPGRDEAGYAYRAETRLRASVHDSPARRDRPIPKK
jgi:hypothetical protein